MKRKYDNLLSSFDVKFYLRRYSVERKHEWGSDVWAPVFSKFDADASKVGRCRLTA